MTQQHNFFPTGDVDKVRFLAKAGRIYRISTAGPNGGAWVAGVDTMLVVRLGGMVLANDDRAPADPSSLIDLHVSGTADQYALVEVTNRGLYGADKAYQLTVEELVPTPTTTAQPTNTATATPTPTPDLRDNFEPDDTTAGARDIAVGETQLHTFYPGGDLDYVRFLAKRGHFYRVATSDLTLGVDTHLTVIINNTPYYSDDALPGSLYSSLICRGDMSSDYEAMVQIANRGTFGSDKRYQITVQELSDQYEPDDVSPTMLTISVPPVPQQHTFYPNNDVDKVQFTAKRGATYRILTSNLGTTIDTNVTVTLKIRGVTVVTYANDDRAAADRASELRFRNGTGEDADAIIEITNRGADQSGGAYTLTVEDVSASAALPLRMAGLARLAWPTAQPSIERFVSAPAGSAVTPLWGGRGVEFVIVVDLKARQ